MFKNLINIANKLDNCGLYNYAYKIDSIIEIYARTQDSLDVLSKYVDQKNIYIHFSNLEKLGINPSSGFNTPIGIYSYPLNTKIFSQIHNDAIPYGGDRKYIHIFETKTDLLDLKEKDVLKDFIKENRDKIINFIEERKSQFLSKISDPQTLVPPLGYNMQFMNLNKYVKYESPDQFIRDYKDTANTFIEEFLKIESFAEIGKYFWFLLNTIAMRDSLLSASLLRNLNVSGMFDPGYGIIHPSEPTQAVIFSKGEINHLQTILNPNRGEVKRKPPRREKMDIVNDLMHKISYMAQDNHKAFVFMTNKFLSWSEVPENYKNNLIFRLYDKLTYENAENYTKIKNDRLSNAGKKKLDELSKINNLENKSIEDITIEDYIFVKSLKQYDLDGLLTFSSDLGKRVNLAKIRNNLNAVNLVFKIAGVIRSASDRMKHNVLGDRVNMFSIYTFMGELKNDFETLEDAIIAVGSQENLENLYKTYDQFSTEAVDDLEKTQETLYDIERKKLLLSNQEDVKKLEFLIKRAGDLAGLLKELAT